MEIKTLCLWHTPHGPLEGHLIVIVQIGVIQVSQILPHCAGQGLVMAAAMEGDRPNCGLSMGRQQVHEPGKSPLKLGEAQPLQDHAVGNPAFCRMPLE